MRRVRRYGPALGFVLVLALTLSGCVHADRSVRLNTDGSGSYTFTLGFSDQVLSLGGGDFVKQMNSCGDTVKAAGGSYRQYADSGYGNWAFTWPFKSVAALNQLIQNSSALCGAGGSASAASGGLTASATDFFKVTETPGFFANTFHATGQMSMVSSASSPDPSTAQLLKDARESFAITFPTYVSAHTGGVASGNTVTYTVHYNEATTIDTTGGGINAIAMAEVAALALIVLLGAVVGFFLLRRRVPAEAASVDAGPGFASVPTLSALSNDEPTLPASPPSDGPTDLRS
jgi:hypothetical protein